jgi:hypothetical protein
MTNDNVSYRKDLCDSCEHLVGDITPTCNLCACPILYIISINSNKCPINKWDEIKETDI